MEKLELGKIYKVSLGNNMVVDAKYVEEGKQNTIVVKPVKVIKDNKLMMATFYVDMGLLQIVNRNQLMR